jgi:ATP-dependent DNA helicase DinG
MAQHPVRVAIDLEMTGTKVGDDAIIDIGGVRFIGDRIDGQPFQSLVRTSRHIPYRIQRLTGISETMLRAAPTLDEVRPRLEAFLGDATLVGHNVPTDAQFLRAEGLAQTNLLIDTHELAIMVLPELKSYTLEALAAHLGVAGSSYHRALADAQTTYRVFLKLLALMEALDTGTLEEVSHLPASEPGTIAPLIRAELRARAGLAGQDTGSSPNLIERFAERLDVHPRVFRLGGLGQTPGVPVARRVSADTQTPTPPTTASLRPAIAQHLQRLLTDGGGLMLDLDGDSADLVSLLTPAVRWAADTGGRVVVSAPDAATMSHVAREVALQAFAASGVNPLQLKVAELSERESYVCLRRWFGGAGVSDGAEIARDVTRGLARVAVWVKQTERGSRWEMTLPLQEQAAWERTRAGLEVADSARNCPYGAAGYCFLASAQKAANEAQLIVTTHTALAASLVGRDDLLPQTTRVIVLDPCALEEELRSARTLALHRWTVMTLLNDLSSRNGTGQHTGLLHWAWQAFCPDDPARGRAWADEVSKAVILANGFFEALRFMANLLDADEHTVRVDDALRRSSTWRPVHLAWEQFKVALDGVIALLHAIANEADAQAPRATSDLSCAMVELLFSARQLDAIRDAGDTLMAPERHGFVSWIRVPYKPDDDNEARRTASLRGAISNRPLDGEIDGPDLLGVHPLYGDSLGRLAVNGNGLALAGPGLVAGGDFEFARVMLGLPRDTRSASHARDRSAQTLLCLPTDVPEPNTPRFQERLNQTLIQLAVEFEGRLIALFPSRNALRAGAGGIRHTLERHGILTLAQGLDGSTRNIWRTFNSERRVVLLGGGSFWNSGLSQVPQSYCIVIPRLPIPAEGDPVVEARAEIWEHPHEQYYVPAAIQRMRVALSRLAWSHEQRNAIVLFDRRAQVRDYGHAVLASLPPCKERRASVDEIARDIREWIGPA